MINTTLQYNNATTNGGGIATEGKNLVTTDSLLQYNIATGNTPHNNYNNTTLHIYNGNCCKLQNNA